MYPKSPFLRNPLVEAQILKRNPDSTTDLMEWLCRAPTITTYRVNLLQTTIAAFKERVQQLLADKYIAPPTVYTMAEVPEVVCIDKLNTPPTAAAATLKEVVVDSCCGAALLRGAHLYAPGVLSMESGTKQGEQVAVYADLTGKCKKGTNTRYNDADKRFVGVGVVRLQRYQLFGAAVNAAGVAVEMQSSVSGVPALGDLSSGEALLQNLPSIVCVRTLQPQAGERVLDMCAAPGNKTTHIAELMRDHGDIVALDKTPKKVEYIRAKLRAHGLHNVRTYAFDATKAVAVGVGNAAEGSPPFAADSFDRILLDAPCSALGNRPLLAANNMTERMLESYPKVQRKLLTAAVQLLKPGGVLVYSTCTVTEAENENMVAWALQKFPQLRLVTAMPMLGGPGLANVGLSEEQRYCVQRYGPAASDTNRHHSTHIDTVGFFIAKFVRKD